MEVIFILIIVGAALGIQAMLYKRKGNSRLSYTARLAQNEIYEGEEAVLTEVLTNGKSLPLPFVKTEIIAPAGLDFGVDAEKSKEDLCYIPSIFSLKGKEQCTRVRKIKCSMRGVFEIGSKSLSGSDLFGISSFSIHSEQSEKLTVLPSPLNTEDFYPSSRLLYGDIQVRRFICEDPFLISGAHEYTGREPMNSIFWNGSARTGRLMTLNKDYTTCSRLLILLTFQRRDEMPVPAANSVCEVLIKAAAFALEQGVKNNAEFTLCIDIPNEETPDVQSGEAFKTEQLRRLAKITPACNQPTVDFIKSGQPENFTDIILITPYLSQTTSDYLKGREGMGQGVRVYSTQCAAKEEDFFVQIRRETGTSAEKR